MNGFRTVVSALCAAMILIGALHLLIPKGAMGKSVKSVLSLAFLLSVLTACIPAFHGFSAEIVLHPDVKTDEESLLTSNAEYVLKEVLQKADISFSKITVCTDKSDDGGISISKVVIVTDCEEKTVKAALSGMDEFQEVVITHE